jgi:hypothetical protein
VNNRENTEGAIKNVNNRENTEGAIKNGNNRENTEGAITSVQSRETGNRMRKNKTKHHYAQTHTDNVNKT